MFPDFLIESSGPSKDLSVEISSAQADKGFSSRNFEMSLSTKIIWQKNMS